MRETSRLVELNIEFLEQGKRLVSHLTDAVYAAIDPPVYASAAGDHFRHILEHYQLFLKGADRDCIDYDARNRDLRISTDRQFTCALIDEIQHDLASIAVSDAPVSVRMAASRNPEADEPLTSSSLCRELQYLQAHTIHHYALIAMIVRMQGVEPDADFGVAPSTLQHRYRSSFAAPVSH